MNTDFHQLEISNPSLFIYKQYETQILSTRKGLVSSLSSKSKDIGTAAQKLLERKIAEGDEKGIPHLFEIFPWLLSDLTDLDSTKVQEISINWLGLYLYISFLDDHLDLNTRIEPDEFIAASVLAQTSLLNLFKIVDNTKYEELFKDSLIASANHELKDVVEKELVYNNDFTKAESASGKNSILLVCAGAVAASSKNNSEFIIDITRELLLTAQLLDDLTDIEEDFKHGNITIPLNSIARDCENSSPSRIEIISLLLQSNSLYKILVQIESSLGKVVTHIHLSGISIQQSNVTLCYFNIMLSKINQLKTYIEDLNSSFKDLTPNDQNGVIKDLEAKLSEIYCHT